jgi:hypothetical protein
LDSDGILHVIWDETTSGTPTTDPGIYYARLDTNGNIEREATLLFEASTNTPRLFQDSEGYLNAVWLRGSDSLFYGKFDTTGQILIPKTFVYAPTTGAMDVDNMEACMDGLDQIHMTYRNYWGYGWEFNLGYSRVNNQGEVLIPYEPLTPEVSGRTCSKGYLVTDFDNNLHLNYLFGESGSRYRYYRKLDQNLNTLYQIILVEYNLFGNQINTGEISLDLYGNAVLVWRDNFVGEDDQYRSATYSTDGLELIRPEMIIEFNFMTNPDLAVGPDNFHVFSWDGPFPGTEESGIIYSAKLGTMSIERPSFCPIVTSPHLLVHPNPANPVTWISFTLPAPQQATLAVYNILGAKVTTLASGFQMPGTHNVIWNASQYSSGLYIIRLETGGWTQAGRVMVVK